MRKNTQINNSSGQSVLPSWNAVFFNRSEIKEGTTEKCEDVKRVDTVKQDPSAVGSCMELAWLKLNFFFKGT